GVQPKGPPDLRIKARRITRQGDAYLVEFELRNVGHQTAKAAVIEGRLLPMKESPSDQEPIETRETEFDYAPSNSVHKGGLYFNHDPKDYVREFKAKSYVVP